MSEFDLAAGDELAFKQAAMIAAMPRHLSARAVLEVACKPQNHTVDLLLLTLDKAGLLRLGAQPFGRDKAANLQLENAVEAWKECLNRPDGDNECHPHWQVGRKPALESAPGGGQLWTPAAMQERFARWRAALGSIGLTV